MTLPYIKSSAAISLPNIFVWLIANHQSFLVLFVWWPGLATTTALLQSTSCIWHIVIVHRILFCFYLLLFIHTIPKKNYCALRRSWEAEQWKKRSKNAIRMGDKWIKFISDSQTCLILLLLASFCSNNSNFMVHKSSSPSNITNDDDKLNQNHPFSPWIQHEKQHKNGIFVFFLPWI